MCRRWPRWRGVSLVISTSLRRSFKRNIGCTHQKILIDGVCDHGKTLHGTRSHNHAGGPKRAARDRCGQIVRGMEMVGVLLHRVTLDGILVLHGNSGATTNDQVNLNVLHLSQDLEETDTIYGAARSTDTDYNPFHPTAFLCTSHLSHEFMTVLNEIHLPLFTFSLRMERGNSKVFPCRNSERLTSVDDSPGDRLWASAGKMSPLRQARSRRHYAFTPHSVHLFSRAIASPVNVQESFSQPPARPDPWSHAHFAHAFRYMMG